MGCIKKYTAYLLRVINKNKKILLFLSVLVTFILVFGDMNRTPYKADDFTYMTNLVTGNKIENLNDIFQSLYFHYFQWGGRIFAVFFLQCMLWIGKPLSSIIFTVAYVATIFIICKISNKCGKVELSTFLLTSGIMYYFNPSWSEAVTWMTGNAVYLVGTLISLIPIFLYYRNENKLEISIVNKFIFFISCLFAGGAIESVGPIIFIFLFYNLVKSKKKSFNWLAYGVLGCLIGCGILILAPGNFIRSAVFLEDFNGYSFSNIAYRAYGINSAIFTYLYQIIIISVSFILVEYNKNKTISESCLFFIMGILSIVLMMVSPTYPSRATFGSMILFLISICCSINSIKLYESNGFLIVSVLLFIGFVMNILPSIILSFVVML